MTTSSRSFLARGVAALEGGLPLIVGGRIVGGIGVSGVNSDQDGVVGKGGVDAGAVR